MRKVWVLILLIAAALLVPVVPFILLGDAFETSIDQWFRREFQNQMGLIVVVGLLASDILLPIPSSGLSTYAGGTFGFLPATIASFTGMTLGGIIGYLLANFLGRPFVERFTKPDDRERLQHLLREHGIAVIAITRPLPILAEATIVLVGAMSMPWNRLLPPLFITNLLIATCYSAFGVWFANYNALPYAIGLSVLVPLLLAMLARLHLSRRLNHAQESRNSHDSASD